MGLPKLKTEGGTGGKRVHANVTHGMRSDEIKRAARRRQRLEGKARIRAALA